MDYENGLREWDTRMGYENGIREWDTGMGYGNELRERITVSYCDEGRRKERVAGKQDSKMCLYP